jgi:hypothetical protein
LLPENTNHPSSERTFLIPTPRRNQFNRWIEAKAAQANTAACIEVVTDTYAASTLAMELNENQKTLYGT